MIKQFQSWWYWNVSSKFDCVDLFATFWFPFMCVVCIWGIWDSAKEQDRFALQCRAKDGIVLQGQNGYVCVDKKFIIK